MTQCDPTLGNTTLVVHIDELVAYGIDRRTAVRLGAELKTELARLIANGGIPTRLRASTDIATLTLPDIHRRPGTNAATSGRGLAAALYQALDYTSPADSTGAQRP